MPNNSRNGCVLVELAACLPKRFQKEDKKISPPALFLEQNEADDEPLNHPRGQRPLSPPRKSKVPAFVRTDGGPWTNVHNIRFC